MDALQVQRLKDRLKNPLTLVLIPHRSPDGDAMGACLGLYHFLKKLGHRVQVISPTDYPKFLKWMPGADRVWVYEQREAEAHRLLEQADLLFYVDFNTLHRTDTLREALRKSQAEVVLIDHHPDPDTFSYNYSDPKMSSSCEMVYHFIAKLGYRECIDAEIATCLYTGIMTDTGSFRFSNTTPSTYRVAAELVEHGADNAAIHQHTCDGYTPQRIALLGLALQNLTLLPDYNTAYIALSSEDLLKHHYQRGDTEGFVNYGLAIRGVKLAVLFIEDRERAFIKISFRSRADFSAQVLARDYFNGGGHAHAAGGISRKSLPETLAYFKSVLKTHWKAHREVS